MAVEISTQPVVAHLPGVQTPAVSFGRPTRHVTDVIWMMIVSGFVIVLVGSFFALTALLFFKTSANADALLAVFTSVVGFLAGLVTPSPMELRGTAGGGK